MKKKVLKIYIDKADLAFVEKTINIKEHIKFEKIEEYDAEQYEIQISKKELEAMAEIIAHSCDYIKSDKKAARLDNIALMLENYLDQL